MARNKVSELMITISGVPEKWANEKILKELEQIDDFAIFPDGTMTIPLHDSTLAKDILEKRFGFFQKEPKERKA